MSTPTPGATKIEMDLSEVKKLNFHIRNSFLELFSIRDKFFAKNYDDR